MAGIDKGLFHEKEIKFNVHVEIKNNKRNALIGYFGLLTESSKEFSCDSTKDMPIKTVLIPAGPITHIRRGFAKGIFILGVLVFIGSSMLGFAIACAFAEVKKKGDIEKNVAIHSLRNSLATLIYWRAGLIYGTFKSF